jgi:hypothetical protein
MAIHFERRLATAESVKLHLLLSYLGMKLLCSSTPSQIQSADETRCLRSMTAPAEM